mgnify:CR=1 FL=1
MRWCGEAVCFGHQWHTHCTSIPLSYAITPCHHPIPSHHHTITPTQHAPRHTPRRAPQRAPIELSPAQVRWRLPPSRLRSSTVVPLCLPRPRAPVERAIRQASHGSGVGWAVGAGRAQCMGRWPAWRCGGVAVWRCGGVAVWQCGRVAGWQGGRAAGWQGSRERRRVAGWWDGGWVVGWAGAKRT